MKIKFEVTQEHYNRANKEDYYLSPSNCLIAQALKDIFDTSFISVGYLTCSMDGKFYNMNEAATKMIADYCSGRPISFPQEAEMEEVINL